MSINLMRLPIGHFVNGYTCPPDVEDSFKIFALIDNGKNTTFEDIKKLENKDKDAARSSFIKFHKKAVTGVPLHTIFDGQQLHPGHEFMYRDSPEKIWRVWLAGKIRIYFVHLPNKIIVILKTIAKRKDDLNDSEKLELENLAKQVINCSEAKLVNIIEGKK